MSETELRWQLRQLPREIHPPHDLWPGIEARLRPNRPERKGVAWWVSLAAAASLCLAVGLAWQAGRSPAPPPPRAGGGRGAPAPHKEKKAPPRGVVAAPPHSA
ncbi:MAG: hypothetical protein K0M70_11430, partial [Arenimonas sp.]|nr:hypothetical protein [Arenimonas sp.]